MLHVDVRNLKSTKTKFLGDVGDIFYLDRLHPVFTMVIRQEYQLREGVPTENLC